MLLLLDQPILVPAKSAPDFQDRGHPNLLGGPGKPVGPGSAAVESNHVADEVWNRDVAFANVAGCYLLL